MSRSFVRPNLAHAPSQKNPTRFRPGIMVEASVTIAGQTFHTCIREGATVNELIEQVAQENGGWVSKKYYPELKAWEIIAVKIGGNFLVKSSEIGIHWSLGSAGIPLAVTNNQEIVFPNGEELRVGRNTNTIHLWTTSSRFDPEDISDLDKRYSASGGFFISTEARERIAKAHGGMRSEKLMLEENILVLNKDTGEIITLSQHASKMTELLTTRSDQFAMPDSVANTFPSYGASTPICTTAIPEIRPLMPVACDAFRASLGSLMIRTFDGAITELVRIKFAPFSQDRYANDNLLAPPTTENEKLVQTAAYTPHLTFCMLAFKKKSRAGDYEQSSSVVYSTKASTTETEKIKRKSVPESEGLKSNIKPASPISPLLEHINSTPPSDLICKAWKAGRSKPICLDVPTSVISTQNQEPIAEKILTARPKAGPDRNPDRKKPRRKENKAPLKLDKLATVPGVAMRLMHRQAIKRNQGKNVRERKKVEENAKSLDKAAHRQKIPRQPARRRCGLHTKQHGISADLRRSNTLKIASAIARQSQTTRCSEMAKRRKRKKLLDFYLYEMLGFFKKKKVRQTAGLLPQPTSVRLRPRTTPNTNR